MDKKISILLLLFGVYYIWDKNQKLEARLNQYTRYQGVPHWQNNRFKNVSPAPFRNSKQWKDWIKSIFQFYGNIKDLFADGGPFSGENQQDIYDVVNQGTRA